MNDRAVILTLHNELVAKIQKQEGTPYSLLALDNSEARTFVASVTKALNDD